MSTCYMPGAALGAGETVSLIIDPKDHLCCNVMSRHLYFPIEFNYLPTLLSIHRKT